MKAKLKIKYLNHNIGEFFQVSEFMNKRITLNIDGKNVDFGFSEVEIVAHTNSDLFQLGKELIWMQDGFIMRQSDVSKVSKNINLPIKKSLIVKSINHYLYGC